MRIGSEFFSILASTGQRIGSAARRAVSNIDSRESSYRPWLDRIASRLSRIPTRSELEAKPLKTWLRRFK